VIVWLMLLIMNAEDVEDIDFSMDLLGSILIVKKIVCMFGKQEKDEVK
jgi:hypothetical protein